MCIIIDANVAADFSYPATADALPILNWIAKKNGQIAVGGGKLASEYEKSSLKRLLIQLLRKGSARVYDRDMVDREQQQVTNLNLCESDDPHIIALARVSGCRLLFSRDQPLHADFKNKHLVNKPRGSVYSTSAHASLLKRCPNCK